MERIPGNSLLSGICLWLMVLSAEGLSCYQCPDLYDFFSLDKDLPKANGSCSVRTNDTRACPPGTSFCIRLEGTFHENQSPYAAKSGIRRGCAPPDILQTFCPAGASYIKGGNCVKVTNHSLSPQDKCGAFAANSTPDALFTGEYCLCQGDGCNGSSYLRQGALMVLLILTVILGTGL